MSFTVNVGSLTVSFENTTDWFPESITRNGSGISTLNSSVNGCVLQINGVFIGGYHDFSDVINTYLSIDGQRVEFVNGGSYSGNTAVFSRTISYSGVIDLEHTMMIRNDKIDENFTARTIESGYDITIFYACLRSFENRFSGFRMYNPSGLLCATGVTVLNNDATHGNATRVKSIHMFDTNTNQLVITTLDMTDDSNHITFIQDRLNDNKLYISNNGWEGITGEKTWNWGQTIRFG